MTSEKQIESVLKKTQISDLLTRYFGAIDDKCLNKTVAEETFTKDAQIVRPNGSVTTGLENILEGHKKALQGLRQHIM